MTLEKESSREPEFTECLLKIYKILTKSYFKKNYDAIFKINNLMHITVSYKTPTTVFYQNDKFILTEKVKYKRNVIQSNMILKDAPFTFKLCLGRGF